MLINCVAVGTGGFIGSVFRYLIGLLPVFSKYQMPFATLIVNVLGAIIIGMTIKSADMYQWMSGSALLFVKVGVCGGFTTFSTFSLEALGMLESGRLLTFGVYVFLSVLLCVLGVLAGKWIIGVMQ